MLFAGHQQNPSGPALGGMVRHDDEFVCDFAEWSPLLSACEKYAALCGWRFVLADFMKLGNEHDSDEFRQAREKAMPMALAYADRVRAIGAACGDGAAAPRLLTEFQVCQRLVASEAVYNSMVATIAAVGLGDDDQRAHGDGKACGGEDEEEQYAYQDMSQPIEVVARRLRAHHARLQASGSMHEHRQRRLLHASFVVEFGLEHGLQDVRDATSEETLREFLRRLSEWEGASGNEVVKALVLESIPPGPAQRSLRTAAGEWFEQNRGAALVGGAIIGGLVGVAVAGAAIALSSARGGRGRR